MMRESLLNYSEQGEREIIMTRNRSLPEVSAFARWRGSRMVDSTSSETSVYNINHCCGVRL